MLKASFFVGIACLYLCLHTKMQVTGLISWAEISYEGVVDRFEQEPDNIRCKKEISNATETTTAPKEICDENVLLLQLSKLYVSSPERVIMMLTNQKDICSNIAHVLSNIQSEFSECVPLKSDNIYVRLQRSIEYFYDKVCKEKSVVTEHMACVKQLREDYMECEAAPDWYEHDDSKAVCNEATDIINCIYVKTAMLCGLKAASAARNLAKDVLIKFILMKCKLSNKVPKIIDPMPDRCQRHLISHLSKLYIIILLIIKVYI